MLDYEYTHNEHGTNGDKYVVFTPAEDIGKTPSAVASGNTLKEAVDKYYRAMALGYIAWVFTEPERMNEIHAEMVAKGLNKHLKRISDEEKPEERS